MNKAKYFICFLLLGVAPLFLISCTHAAVASQPSEPSRSRAETDAVEVVIWAVGAPRHHWRLDGPLRAAASVTEVKIRATGVLYPEGSGYREQFVSAAEAGRAVPDILQKDTTDLHKWAEAGYIVPIDTCRLRHSEFEDVIEELWQPVTWQGQTWGVPLGASMHLLYFHKLKLKQLGWSEADIAALPARIERGQFTWEDVLATARDAIAKGIVEPGFGYWPDPKRNSMGAYPYFAYGDYLYNPNSNKLLISAASLAHWYTFQRRLVTEGVTHEDLLSTDWQTSAGGRGIFHDTVAHGRVLFWKGFNRQWSEWATMYVADLGGDSYLRDFVGYALLPSAIKGRPGGTHIGLELYSIASEKATGRQHQEAACALLAKTMTPEINSLYALEATYRGVLESQAGYAEYNQHPLLAATHNMIDDDWITPHDPRYEIFNNILWAYMIEAKAGRLSPAEAATAAIDQLRHELGDEIIVEK